MDLTEQNFGEGPGPGCGLVVISLSGKVFNTFFFEAGFENNNFCACFARVTHQNQDDAEAAINDDDDDHFLLEVEEDVGQLPRPAAAPPGIISSKYCR